MAADSTTKRSRVLRLATRYLTLPAEVSPIERRYLRRMNLFSLFVCFSHVPGLAVLAWLADTSLPAAVALGLVEAAVIGTAYWRLHARPRVMSVVFGANGAFLGALILYVGRGPMQDELRIYLYVAMTLMVAFANPSVILALLVAAVGYHAASYVAFPALAFTEPPSGPVLATYVWFALVEAAVGAMIARGFFEAIVLLERKVVTRTMDLKVRAEATARILDNVAQGLVTAELDGAITSECSRQLVTWFGPIGTSVRVWDYLAAHDPSLAAWIELTFTSLRDDLLPVEVALGQLPSRVDRDGKNFRLEYVPIKSPATGVLFVISDITAEVARATYEEQQRELIAVVERAYSDRTGFLAFLSDGSKLVREAGGNELAEVRRALHTLKGNASLFGISSIARSCHALEDYIDSELQLPAVADRARLAEAWTGFRERVQRLLGISERRTLIVDWNEYQSVVAAFPTPEPAYLATVRQWGRDATRPYLERFAEQAHQLAERLEKPTPTIEIFDHGVRVVPDRFAAVWSAFVHAVRNAVDHGLERAEARAAAGKSPTGRLTLRTELVGGELAISIGDDGAGIDWARVAASARARGLPATSHDDLVAAIFADGVSTASSVTEISGRGVGMSALHHACTALGGRIEVRSEPGRGTTITCRVPTGVDASLTTPPPMRERPHALN